MLQSGILILTLAFAQSTEKPRAVVTTDPELDDANSLIRYLPRTYPVSAGRRLGNTLKTARGEVSPFVARPRLQTRSAPV